MNQRTILLTAAFFGMSAVGLGAFGAHAFKNMLLSSGRMETYDLAVRYQFYHALALMIVGMMLEKFPALKTGALLFILGTIIFSGSLFTLALSNQGMWGAVTPFGGALLIAGWLRLAWTFYTSHG